VRVCLFRHSGVFILCAGKYNQGISQGQDALLIWYNGTFGVSQILILMTMNKGAVCV